MNTNDTITIKRSDLVAIQFALESGHACMEALPDRKLNGHNLAKEAFTFMEKTERKVDKLLYPKGSRSR